MDYFDFVVVFQMFFFIVFLATILPFINGYFFSNDDIFYKSEIEKQFNDNIFPINYTLYIIQLIKIILNIDEKIIILND